MSDDRYRGGAQPELTPEELANIPLFMPKVGAQVDLDKFDIADEDDASMFLFPEDSTKQRAADSKISTWTGVSFLSGMFGGAAWGMAEGLRAGTRAGQPRRVLFNTVLNSMGRRSSFLGTYGAVIALMLAINDTVIEKFVTGRQDNMNTLAASVLTGVMFKGTTGPRQMALAGAMGGGLYGLGMVGSNVIGAKKVIPF